MDWIPVSTPPTAEDQDNELIVAVMYPDNGLLPHATRAYYSPDRGFWKESIRYLPGQITHWMPMPPLPIDELKMCQCCGKNKAVPTRECPASIQETCNCCDGCRQDCLNILSQPD